MNNIKTYISNSSIQRIQKHKYLTSKTPESEKYNKDVYKNIVRLLIISQQNNSNECLIIFDDTNGDIWHPVKGQEHTVRFDKQTYNMLKYNSNTCSIIHNHPNNSPFSLQDLATTLIFTNISRSYVVTNDGKRIYVFIKSNIFRRNIYTYIGKLLKKLIAQKKLDGHSDPVKYIKLMKFIGLKCRGYYNQGGQTP